MYVHLFTGTHVELSSFIHTFYFTETYNHAVPDSTGCTLFVVAMGKHIVVYFVLQVYMLDMFAVNLLQP